MTDETEHYTDGTERCPTCNNIAEAQSGMFEHTAKCGNGDCYRTYFIRRVDTDTNRPEENYE